MNFRFSLGNKVFAGLMIISSLLSACVSTSHTPYLVNQIPARANIIASQTQNQLRPALATIALMAYNKAQLAGHGYKSIYTIIDYSLPSTKTRLWVIDLAHNRVLFQEKVAHGIGSGQLYATQFSDQINSKESSIGMYTTTANGYRGRHGYSLRLIGLEPGFNAQAYTRAIVLHSAAYVSDDYIEQHGYLGPTWGCPAINAQHLVPLIQTVKGGTLLFIYGNDARWLKQSIFLPHPRG